MGPLVLILGLLLALSLAVTEAPYWWFGVAFFGAFLLANVVSTPRSLRGATQMRDELSRRTNTGRSVR